MVEEIPDGRGDSETRSGVVLVYLPFDLPGTRAGWHTVDVARALLWSEQFVSEVRDKGKGKRRTALLDELCNTQQRRRNGRFDLSDCGEPGLHGYPCVRDSPE